MSDVIIKYWYEKYNAYPAVVGYDTWELFIEKLPNTEEEARELAIEHYYFCLDRVDQYGENYDHGKLAGTLLIFISDNLQNYFCKAVYDVRNR